ncbi:AraC family transcriptional regulator [Jeongeupia chitinilytica]|uniref:Transcriptional regulator n=1 Tax=Jeongeupia chitinilytica TaxID=1041641 RepID=A0ABQ3H569_9NEIS|nr:helix-turn-helix transcriptional regulator [Jeongeupia chitinilytica]GHD67751.1 transcriptional regulator [Jeongeupia chitinilytica]
MAHQYSPRRDFDHLPYPVCFRFDALAADTECELHHHAWGQLNYAERGVMQIDVGGQRFISPPQYTVWLPPGVVHGTYNQQPVLYRALDLDPSLCGALPAQPCMLAISAVLRAILIDFAERQVAVPDSDADRRLAQVVVDQLGRARVEPRYLPLASTPSLQQVLAALQREPGDNRTASEWAETVHLTERTLARYCQRELGMSLGEWRQRLRFLHAIELLDKGRSVQAIALDLGYSTSSAFIAMFQRQAGTTPEQYRRELPGT